MSPPNRPLTTYVLLTVVVVIWASYPTLIKVALADMPPFTLAALRCTIGSTILAVPLSGADARRASSR